MLRHKHGSHTHPTANAHARHEHPSASLLRDAQASGDLPCTRASKRVTDSNRTSVDVDLLLRDPEVLHAHHSLARKRLVDLVEVDVVEGQGGELEDLGDGERWADTHNARGDSDDGRGDELAEDGEAKALGNRAAGEDDGGSTIGDLRSIAGVRGAVLLEGGLQLGETLLGDTIPDA